MRDLHKRINILGIKLKLFDFKSFKEYVFDNIRWIRDDINRRFIYSNDEKMSNADRILFLSKMFYEKVGYYPNLKYPKTFCEKLNWKKLNYYNPNEKRVVDKYEFKNYIKEKIGDDYTIPLIKMYEDINDINFDELPEQFVLKTTWNGGSAGVFIIKDKKKANINRIKYCLSTLMVTWRGFYASRLSRGYKEVRPRIIVEEYIKDIENIEADYKFFCFHGKVKCFYIANNWAKFKNNQMVTYYDMNCNQLPIEYGDHKKNKIKKLKPSKNFNKMIELAEILSKDFPFVRADFYDLGDKLYVGEMTFTPGSGFGQYKPIEWDYKLGEWLDLNKLNEEYVNILPELQTNSINNIVKKE